MSTDMLKTLSWETLKTTGAIMGVSMLGGDMITNIMPNNKIGAYGAKGVSYSIARDLVDYATERKSSFLSMNPYLIADDIVFFSFVSAGVNETRLIDQTYTLINNFSPLDKNIIANLTEGLVISGSTLIANAFDIGSGGS